MCVCVFTMMFACVHTWSAGVCVNVHECVCFFSQGVSFSPWPDGALTTGQMVNTLLSFFKPSSILLSPSISPFHHSPQTLIPYLPESLPPNVLLLINQTKTKFHFVLSHIHSLKLFILFYLFYLLLFLNKYGQTLEIFVNRHGPGLVFNIWRKLGSVC